MEKERKLSERENLRVSKVEKLSEEMKANGYERKNHIISIEKANSISAVVLLVSCVIFGGWFFLQNGGFNIGDISFIPVAVAFIVCIVLHEGIHGLTWGLFAKNHYKFIEFGVIFEKMTPYCYCGEPLKKEQYMIGLFMPCFVLGIVISVAAVFMNSIMVLALGLFNIMGAGGDLTIISRLLSYKSDAKDIIYMDHPSECGFITFEK